MRSAAVWVGLALGSVPGASSVRVLKKQGQGEKEGIPLCDAAIVEDTCEAFNNGAASTLVSKLQVQEMLSSSEAEMSELWTTIGLDLDAKVSCEDLCLGVVKALDAEGAAPPFSDTGCELDQDGIQQCDEDLSLGEVEIPPNATIEALDLPISPDGDLGQEAVSTPTVDYDYGLLLRHVAHFFRIYPALNVDVVTSEGGPSTQTSIAACKNANQRGISYITKALKATSSSSLMTTWFGDARSSTVSKVKSVLNSASKVMANVAFVYPPDYCLTGVNAFVYPKGDTGCRLPYQWDCQKNDKGQYIFFICERLFKRHLSYYHAIVMVHEGTHMYSAYTKDHVYGEDKSKGLAKNDQAKALTNADNYMFYTRYANN